MEPKDPILILKQRSGEKCQFQNIKNSMRLF